MGEKKQEEKDNAIEEDREVEQMTRDCNHGLLLGGVV
jgi:hypothetical protein